MYRASPGPVSNASLPVNYGFPPRIVLGCAANFIRVVGKRSGGSEVWSFPGEKSLFYGFFATVFGMYSGRRGLGKGPGIAGSTDCYGCAVEELRDLSARANSADAARRRFEVEPIHFGHDEAGDDGCLRNDARTIGADGRGGYSSAVGRKYAAVAI